MAKEPDLWPEVMWFRASEGEVTWSCPTNRKPEKQKTSLVLLADTADVLIRHVNGLVWRAASEWQPVCWVPLRLSSPTGYIKVPMSSFPSFYVSCLGRGTTLHGKTEGRVWVDWGNSFHHEAHFFFQDISWHPFSDLHLIFIMDTTGVAMHELLYNTSWQILL